MKPDGSGVADCMKMKEVSVMNVEKKKKNPTEMQRSSS